MGEKLTELQARYEAEARVVYDRRHDYHDAAGPTENGRIGVAFGSEVFWTGSYCFPGDDMATYGAKVGFATELAARWNAAASPSNPEPSNDTP